MQVSLKNTFLNICIVILLSFSYNVESFLEPKNSEFCYAALDIVQVQDMTSSFDTLWIKMAEQVDSVMKLIKSLNPESQFGLVTFGDKNVSGISPTKKVVHKLGYSTDYCAKIDLPLSEPNSQAMIDIFGKYSKKFQGGGGDWPENAFGAIYRTLLSTKIKWREDYTKSKEGTAKVIVLVTDATSHIAGDVFSFTQKKLPPFSLSGLIDDENKLCDKIDYPSVKSLVKLLKEKNVYLIILAAPGGQYDETSGKFYVTESLAKQGEKYRSPEGLVQWYQDIFEEEEFTNLLIQQLDPQMISYSKVFLHAIEKFNSFRCQPSTASPKVLKPNIKKPTPTVSKKTTEVSTRNDFNTNEHSLLDPLCLTLKHKYHECKTYSAVVLDIEID